MAKPDPLAAALDGAKATSGGNIPRMVILFGDRPDVLDSVIAARKERRLPFKQIARVLSSGGESISAGAVQTWLGTQGVD